MSVHLPKAGSDNNAWITFNDFMKTQIGEGEYIEVVANANNPPSVSRYTRFTFYNTDNTYTIPATPTNNNSYPPNDTPEYLVAEAIYEDGAARTFNWNDGNFPIQSDGTWYLYCTGADPLGDETTKGKGVYGAGKGDLPTWSYEKGGYYSAGGLRVLAEFTSDSGTVVLTRIFNDPIHRNSSGDIYFKNNDTNKEMLFQINDDGTINTPFKILGSTSRCHFSDDTDALICRTGTNEFLFFDDKKLKLGGGGDGEIYSSGNDLYIRNITEDKNIIFELNNGGIVKEILRINGSIPSVNLLDNIQMQFGTGQDGYIYTNLDDEFIIGTSGLSGTSDIIFEASFTEIFKIDGFNGFLRVPDGIKLTLGTGNDGQIYSSSDDLFIDNVTQDKDIKIRINDDGVQTGLMFFDGSTSRVGIGKNFVAPKGISHIQFTSQTEQPYAERITSNLGGLASAQVYKVTTTGTPGENLGPALFFSIQGNLVPEEDIGVFGFGRDGADDSGRFQLGTYLNGDVGIQMEIDSEGKVFFGNLNGEVTSGAIMYYNTGTGEVTHNTSSEKYKENIEPIINEDTNWIYDIDIKKYDRKNGSKIGEIGIIAEELEIINPKYIFKKPSNKMEITQAISKNKFEGYGTIEVPEPKWEIEGINYIELIPVLIAELKKLKAQINAL